MCFQAEASNPEGPAAPSATRRTRIASIWSKNIGCGNFFGGAVNAGEHPKQVVVS